MNYFSMVILYCIKKIKGERSVSSIFHLFKGKRSSQTIQDAKLYQTYHLFGVFPLLGRKEIEDSISQLIKEKAIERCSDNSYVVTEYGEQLLNRFSLPSSLNGWKYTGQAHVLWERLALLVQVLSNLVHHETRYIPISRDMLLLHWVKTYIKNMAYSRDELSKILYTELADVLGGLEDINSNIFVTKLTGHNRIGSTNEQVSEIFQLSSYEVIILFTSTLHHILQVTIEEKERYPVLSKIISTSTRELSLTQSTEKTYQLLHQGYSLEMIASIRQLKKNTIEDHIVEIALADETFDTTPYVDSETFNRIEKCIKELQTNQLKVIKNTLTIPVSYFEIRLVLAKVVGGIYEA